MEQGEGSGPNIQDHILATWNTFYLMETLFMHDVSAFHISFYSIETQNHRSGSDLENHLTFFPIPSFFKRCI